MCSKYVLHVQKQKMSTASLKNSTDAFAASVRFPNHAPQWAVLTHIGLFWQESSYLTFTTCYSREQLCPSPKMMEIFFTESASLLLPLTSVWAPRRKGTPSRRQVIGLPFSKYFFHLDLLQSTASSCIMPSYAIRTWEWWMKIWHVKNMPIWTSIWEECVSHQTIGFLACGDTFTNVKCKTYSFLTEGNFPFLPIFSNEQKKRPLCTWLLWSGVILWKLRQSATLRVSHMCRQATPLSSSLHLSPL